VALYEHKAEVRNRRHWHSEVGRRGLDSIHGIGSEFIFLKLRQRFHGNK
jgi:hypothetical protein